MMKYTSAEAYALLYSSYNDIDIFVEDKSLVGIYEKFFKAIFEGRYRIEAITALGPKSAVIAAAQKSAGKANRKQIFVVDGDFDWCWGTTPKAKNLYELKVYSIENFAFDDPAMFGLAQDNMPNLTHAQAEKKIDLAAIDAQLSLLLPLMKLYAVARALKSELKTVTFSIEQLKNKKDGSIDVKRVSLKVRSFYKELAKEKGRANVVLKRKELEKNLAKYSNVPRRMIAGKHSGIKLLIKHFQEKACFRGTKEHFLSALIGASTMSLDPSFISYLKKA